jgi:hypothetical protein
MNQVRSNPSAALPDLEAILCSEYKPVPSPGKVYDAAITVCKVINAPLWSLTSRLIARRRGRSVGDFCDEQVRKLLRLGNAPKKDCKTMNMGDDGVYLRSDGVRVQTVEGRYAVLEAIEFIKAQKPLTALEWNTDMWKSCRDHAEE